MVESIQNMPKFQDVPTCQGTACPSQVEPTPSLEELFKHAQDIAKDVQGLIGNAGHALDDKAISFQEAFVTTTKELQKGLGDGVKNMQSEFFKALTGLNAIFEGARPAPGLVGGPRTVHPNAFKSQIETLKEQVKTSKAETPEEQEALEELKDLLGKLTPAYEAYVGAGVHYPSAENESIRYVDVNGNEITKEQFENLKTDFKAALENTTQAFLDDTSKRVQAVVTNLISNLEDMVNKINI